MYLGFYWLAMANCCVNPLVYYSMNKRWGLWQELRKFVISKISKVLKKVHVFFSFFCSWLTDYAWLTGFVFTSGACCVSAGLRARRRWDRPHNGKCRTALSTGPGGSPGSAETLSGNSPSIFHILSRSDENTEAFILIYWGKYLWETFPEKSCN